ncbi:MipA/OmpV family protein [Shewanella sp. A3A]|nr:MipA/OmpV family protein [Shewanella ferrihydritica]
MSQREAVASGLNAFESDSGFLPYVNLTANYQVTPELSTSLALRYTWEPSEVADSPMVERDGIFSTYFTVTYKM